MNVTFTELFLLPLLATLIGMFACWMFYNWRRPARHKSIQDNLFRCKVCRHVYVDHRDLPMSGCELCGSMNEAVKR